MVVDKSDTWPLLDPDSAYLHDWRIPTREGVLVYRLRWGCGGFVVCHLISWWADKIEPVYGGGDDFGHSARYIAGTDTPSNHWRGTAADINASEHPQGRDDTLLFRVRGLRAIDRLRARLLLYRGCVRSGAFYNSTPDEMHIELIADLPTVNKLALLLMLTPRGRRILKANPGQEKIIKS